MMVNKRIPASVWRALLDPKNQRSLFFEFKSERHHCSILGNQMPKSQRMLCSFPTHTQCISCKLVLQPQANQKSSNTFLKYHLRKEQHALVTGPWRVGGRTFIKYPGLDMRREAVQVGDWPLSWEVGKPGSRTQPLRIITVISGTAVNVSGPVCSGVHCRERAKSSPRRLQVWGSGYREERGRKDMRGKERSSTAAQIQRRPGESKAVIDRAERTNARFSQLGLRVLHP